MVDVAVASGAAWVCPAQGRHLADVLLPVLVGNKDDDGRSSGSRRRRDKRRRPGAVGADGGRFSLCADAPVQPVLSHRHQPLLVISEARTMEVYSRGRRNCGTFRQRARLQEAAAPRASVLSLKSARFLCRLVVGLQQLQPCLARGPGIDMQQVQCLVEEMGTSLSPGAQNLMDMVHFQQKNQTGSLGGFLPLLMGSGALSALAQGAMMSPAALSRQPQPADSRPQFGSITPADEAPPAQNGAMSNGSASSSPDPPLSGVNPENITSSESRGPVSHAQLAEMMSRFLNGGQGNDQS
ncbi:putative protein C10orf88-like protein [Larimichthys crocea]|uniref:Uncharacterized protein n=1 Tax=Larimichthys crocea TaxID=215358 RepID=A0A6G0HX97_LARCR|nr:putative protein C10orf88-like protein [Larimichthys crocea]